MTILTISQQLLLALVLAAVCRLCIQRLRPFVKTYIARKPWYPFVIENQKRMLHNLGFPSKPTPPLFPEGISDELSLDVHAALWMTVFFHAVCGTLMLPVFLLGWEHSGSVGQNAFLLGTIGDVGFDIQDLIMITLSTYFPERFGMTRTPKGVFAVAILHHPLAMLLTIPLNLSHLDHPSYHQIAFHLLFAAAICYGFGNYKMTLDVNKASHLLQFKAIVFCQLVTIIYTRVFMWFPEFYRLAAHVYESGDIFLVGIGVPLGILMTVFGLALVSDAISAAFKWLPRQLPATTEEREAMREEVLCSESAMPDVPNAVVETLTPRSKQRYLDQLANIHRRNCNTVLAEDKNEER